MADGARTLIGLTLGATALAGFAYLVLTAGEHLLAVSLRTLEELGHKIRDRRIARYRNMGLKPEEIERLERLGAAELAQRIQATVSGTAEPPAAPPRG